MLDPQKREALRLVDAFLSKQRAHVRARKSGDRIASSRLAIEVEEARVAATLGHTLPVPRVADVLASRDIDPGALVHAIAGRLPSCSPPSSVRRAPRQVVRAVLQSDMQVGCGGFPLLAQNAQGWFRVAAPALDAMGQTAAAALFRDAWKVAVGERLARRELACSEYLRVTRLGRFDDEGYRLIQQALGAPLVAYVERHADDFLELDDP